MKKNVFFYEKSCIANAYNIYVGISMFFLWGRIF